MQHKGKKYTKRKLLDNTFDLEKSYFFRDLSSANIESIKKFLHSYFNNGNKDEESLKNYFSHLPNLKKGKQNIRLLREALNEVAKEFKEKETFFDSFLAINNFIIDEYMGTKPSVQEVLFFPSEANQDKVANMIRTCKKSLHIAVFTITNDKLSAAIEEAHDRGVKVRIITDDECCKNLGSDIYSLAASVNILKYILGNSNKD